MFTLTQVKGISVRGAIMGAGGILTNEEQVRQLIRRANRGRPLLVPEPWPGHVIVYPNHTASADGTAVIFDLRGAEVSP